MSEETVGGRLSTIIKKLRQQYDAGNSSAKAVLNLDSKLPCASVDLGLVNLLDLPSYSRLHKDDSSVETFEGFLHVAFRNPSCLRSLCDQFNIEEQAQYSLFDDVMNANYNDSEFGKHLRKIQSERLAMRSVSRGVELFRAGHSAEAIQHFNKALQIDQENVEALVARGALHANGNSFKIAIDDFEHALKINPTHANARKYLVETLVAQGKKLEASSNRQAMLCYRKAKELNPNIELSYKMSTTGESTEVIKSRDASVHIKRLLTSDSSALGAKLRLFCVEYAKRTGIRYPEDAAMDVSSELGAALLCYYQKAVEQSASAKRFSNDESRRTSVTRKRSHSSRSSSSSSVHSTSANSSNSSDSVKVLNSSRSSERNKRRRTKHSSCSSRSTERRLSKVDSLSRHHSTSKDDRRKSLSSLSRHSRSPQRTHVINMTDQVQPTSCKKVVAVYRNAANGSAATPQIGKTKEDTQKKLKDMESFISSLKRRQSQNKDSAAATK